MKTEEQVNQYTEELAGIFATLSDPTRLKLIKLLYLQRNSNALCVSALARLLEVTQPAVSQHLRVLKAINLVKGERQGYRIHYFINPQKLIHLRQQISKVLDFKGQIADKNSHGK
jgi:DNA-binding transcriptional ArsR family regulator